MVDCKLSRQRETSKWLHITSECWYPQDGSGRSTFCVRSKLLNSDRKRRPGHVDCQTEVQVLPSGLFTSSGSGDCFPSVRYFCRFCTSNARRVRYCQKSPENVSTEIWEKLKLKLFSRNYGLQAGFKSASERCVQLQ